MRDSGGRLLDIVAKLTGTTTAAVVAERQAGKTFTQIAAAKNIKSSTVVDEALKVRTAVLAEKVKSGAITQAQADAAAANMKTRLTTRVDSVNTACDGSGAGGGKGGGMGGGRGARSRHGWRRYLHRDPVASLGRKRTRTTVRLRPQLHKRVPAVGYSRSGPRSLVRHPRSGGI